MDNNFWIRYYIWGKNLDFVIDFRLGVMKVKRSFDREYISEYEVIIVVIDFGFFFFIVIIIVFVLVIDVNDNVLIFKVLYF